jgi:hypothetical protein
VGSSAFHDLLLNLKLQLLGVPNLLKWGLLTFAVILMVREGITLVWNARHRRHAPGSDLDTPGRTPAAVATAPQSRLALPAPDPFAAPLRPAPEVVVQEQRSLPECSS